MKPTRRTTSDGLAILDRRHFQLAELVKTTDSVISRLEDADYVRHSLEMRQRISAALNRRLEIHFVPLRGRRKTA